MKPLFQKITLKDNLIFKGCVVEETKTDVKVVASADLSAAQLEQAYTEYGPLNEGIVFGLCSKNTSYDACDGASFYSIPKSAILEREECAETKRYFEGNCGFYELDGAHITLRNNAMKVGWDAKQRVQSIGVDIGHSFHRSSEDGFRFSLKKQRGRRKGSRDGVEH